MYWKQTLLTFFALMLAYSLVNGQDKPIEDMTREDVVAMTYDELVALPLEDLMQLAEIAGVSVDELYEMVLNPEQKIASKTIENIFEAPLSTSVLTAEEIRMAGATSIPEALRLMTGVIVREKTPGNYDVHLRGNDNIPPGNLMLYSENSQTLVMVNNHVMYNYAHGGTLWETLPISVFDIERIEVVRGPASSMYGPNAVTGVINIITHQPINPEFDAQANVAGGYPAMADGQFAANLGASKKLRFRLSGNYKHYNRSMEKLYMWPFEGYKDVAYIDSVIPGSNPPRQIKPHKAENYYPDPSLAIDRYGANGYMYFDPASDIHIEASGGLQNSEVITSIIDDSYISYARRTSMSAYGDLDASVKGLHAQVSYLQGTQNASVGSDGFAYDMQVMHSKLEYDLRLGDNFRLQPGVFYQWTSYDDSPYVADSLKAQMPNLDHSLFSEENILSNLAVSLRADYTFREKLRLVAAVRDEFYKYPDEDYISFQFAATYNMNDKHLLRAVYSRANRGPFMADVHTDYDWQQSPTMLLHFDGNPELGLLTSDMYEMGYRNRIWDRLFFDVELFYTQTTNYASLMPDYVHLDPQNTHPTEGYPLPDSIHIGYANLDLEAMQMGASLKADVIFNQNLYLTAFGTYQQTELAHADPTPINEIITEYSTNAVAGYVVTGTQTGGNYTPLDSSFTHEATPSFFGGFSLNYKPTPRWKMNLSGYYYTGQTFIHKHGTTDIEPKIIPNIKVSYNLLRDSWIYLNARNFIHSRHNEFAFLDEVGGKYFVGFVLNL